MAAATLASLRHRAPEPLGPDGVLLAFVRLCRQLDRPVTEAELRAAATPARRRRRPGLPAASWPRGWALRCGPCGHEPAAAGRLTDRRS